jgi:hypothetical protein
MAFLTTELVTIPDSAIDSRDRSEFTLPKLSEPLRLACLV